MGFTSVKVGVANPANPAKAVKVELLVDTGAMYSIVPRSLLEQLKIRPEGTKSFTLATGDRIRREVGGAVYKFDRVVGYASVIFGEKGDQPLLGVTALEDMGLQVDPVSKKLKSAELYLI